MRVALLYPPPWKLPRPGEPPPERDGAPAGWRPGDLDADFHQIPYGLLQLGAEALRAGHRVKVLNLSAFPWEEVERVVAALEADVYGLSCWTANRRGVDLVSREIRRRHPRAVIVTGGPHATPLAREVLAHYVALDAVCRGEADETFLDLLDRVARGEGLVGLPGTVVRAPSGELVEGPPRPKVADLNRLEIPHRHFATHVVMTSRGCAWACTFCGAETTWGRGFRAQSVDYVLDLLEAALARLPVRMIQIKDDTFTTNQKRVLALCRGIRERGLRFLWSCDTRVDVLSDELLREMRLAGCQRLSLGVESGDPGILAAIDKRITPEEILASTELAKRYGIRVRYYMMIGNRGETRRTFEESLGFLARAAPHESIFSCLSVYPGTRDAAAAEAAGWLDRERWFREDFQELKVPFDASDADTAYFNDWFSRNSGLRRGPEPTRQELEAVLARLGEHHAAHADLGAALLEEGALDRAEQHFRRALELGYPCPGLALSSLAVIAQRRGDLDGMMALLLEAARTDPQHWTLIQNAERARAWFRERGPERGLPLELSASHHFQLLERTWQPTLPGPLSEDFARWDASAAPVEGTVHYRRAPGQEGSRAPLRLKVL